ncbi:metallophosphatase family protein [Clostridium sp. DSM 100503]|uniref:metallophosphoesterase family protein n=1 Tax=Clostridium sp. DSM 100503 TaxID=2963282 RepID=UPI002149ED13|nr:metallophosphoesterase family protein [Clostridium sp. DSM 100503]MCR1950369.1 metallophosphatase family protein [Clostridium sp. DSM 100503]
MKIGIISDTHNLLREEVICYLNKCDLIIHAGDICNKEILLKLNSITKTVAVKGNNDNENFEGILNKEELLEIEGKKIYVVHEKNNINVNLEEVDIIIYGHSHKHSLETLDNVIYLNPGSCGKRRFSLPLTMAIMNIKNGKVQIEKIDINN